MNFGLRNKIKTSICSNFKIDIVKIDTFNMDNAFSRILASNRHLDVEKEMIRLLKIEYPDRYRDALKITKSLHSIIPDMQYYRCHFAIDCILGALKGGEDEGCTDLQSILPEWTNQLYEYIASPSMHRMLVYEEGFTQLIIGSLTAAACISDTVYEALLDNFTKTLEGRGEGSDDARRIAALSDRCGGCNPAMAYVVDILVALAAQLYDCVKRDTFRFDGTLLVAKQPHVRAKEKIEANFEMSLRICFESLSALKPGTVDANILAAAVIEKTGHVIMFLIMGGFSLTERDILQNLSQLLVEKYLLNKLGDARWENVIFATIICVVYINMYFTVKEDKKYLVETTPRLYKTLIKLVSSRPANFGIAEKIGSFILGTSWFPEYLSDDIGAEKLVWLFQSELLIKYGELVAVLEKESLQYGAFAMIGLSLAHQHGVLLQRFEKRLTCADHKDNCTAAARKLREVLVPIYSKYYDQLWKETPNSPCCPGESQVMAVQVIESLHSYNQAMEITNIRIDLDYLKYNIIDEDPDEKDKSEYSMAKLNDISTILVSPPRNDFDALLQLASSIDVVPDKKTTAMALMVSLFGREFGIDKIGHVEKWLSVSLLENAHKSDDGDGGLGDERSEEDSITDQLMVQQQFALKMLYGLEFFEKYSAYLPDASKSGRITVDDLRRKLPWQHRGSGRVDAPSSSSSSSSSPSYLSSGRVARHLRAFGKIANKLASFLESASPDGKKESSAAASRHCQNTAKHINFIALVAPAVFKAMLAYINNWLQHVVSSQFKTSSTEVSAEEKKATVQALCILVKKILKTSLKFIKTIALRESFCPSKAATLPLLFLLSEKAKIQLITASHLAAQVVYALHITILGTPQTYKETETYMPEELVLAVGSSRDQLFQMVNDGFKKGWTLPMKPMRVLCMTLNNYSFIDPRWVGRKSRSGEEEEEESGVLQIISAKFYILHIWNTFCAGLTTNSTHTERFLLVAKDTVCLFGPLGIEVTKHLSTTLCQSLYTIFGILAKISKACDAKNKLPGVNCQKKLILSFNLLSDLMKKSVGLDESIHFPPYFQCIYTVMDRHCGCIAERINRGRPVKIYFKVLEQFSNLICISVDLLKDADDGQHRYPEKALQFGEKLLTDKMYEKLLSKSPKFRVFAQVYMLRLLKIMWRRRGWYPLDVPPRRWKTLRSPDVALIDVGDFLVYGQKKNFLKGQTALLKQLLEEVLEFNTVANISEPPYWTVGHLILGTTLNYFLIGHHHHDARARKIMLQLMYQFMPTRWREFQREELPELLSMRPWLPASIRVKLIGMLEPGLGDLGYEAFERKMIEVANDLWVYERRVVEYGDPVWEMAGGG
jgi:hypothetical protein